MATQRVPEAGGIDLDFTPRSFFAERDLGLRLPSDILGQARREMARRAAAENEDLEPALLEPALSADDRRALGAIHPMFMGGEYLPALDDDEVEIARISLESVTADQISVRARHTADGIGYAIVDEYFDDPFVTYVAEPRTSAQPLSLRDLVAMLDGACERGGAVMSHVVRPVEEGFGVDEYRDFVSVESDFYPDLGRYYAARLAAYFDSLAVDDEPEEEEDA